MVVVVAVAVAESVLANESAAEDKCSEVAEVEREGLSEE